MNRTATGDNPGDRSFGIPATLAFLLLCGGLAYVAAQGWQWLFPAMALEARTDGGCDLHQGPCIVRFQDGTVVSLDIEPKTIRPMEPLVLRVTVAGVNAHDVTLDFEGARMNMGRLSADIREMSDGSFAGDAILPVCIRRQMTWQANVGVRSPQGSYQAFFEFEVYGPLSITH